MNDCASSNTNGIIVVTQGEDIFLMENEPLLKLGKKTGILEKIFSEVKNKWVSRQSFGF